MRGFVFILHAGGLGDLILLAPAFDALRRAMPDSEIVLCCRREFASIVELFPGQLDRAIAFDVNPYAWMPFDEAEFHRIGPLLGEVRALRCDLFLSAELAPTWLTTVLAAATAPGRALRLAAEPTQGSPALRILQHFGLSEVPFETYEASDDAPERTRYDALLERIGVAPSPQTSLFVRIPNDARVGAARIIEEHALQEKRILACFPAGNTFASIKRWPFERFLTVIEQAALKHDVVPLLVGDASDREYVEELVRALAAGNVHACSYIDVSSSVPLTAAIVARTAAFLSNDTGLAHLGAALGVPGVTVYGGGGRFSSYAPWAPGTIGVVHPLPCFGCGWDCAFGHALCIESIEVSDVISALDRLLAAPPEKAEIVELSCRSEFELRVIGDAARVHREVQADRMRRLEIILELERELASERHAVALRGLEAEQGRRAFDAVQARVTELETELHMLNQAAHEKEEELQLQSTAAQERLRLVENLSVRIAELSREHDAAVGERERLLRHIASQETVIDALADEVEELALREMDAEEKQPAAH